MTYALSVVQGLLALLFLFAGTKLVLPLEALTQQMPCRARSCGSSAWPRCSARSA
jgi:hypothetical protein